MALKNNIHYLKLSVSNSETFLDTSGNLHPHYIFPDWDQDINKYISKTVKIKELLTTIKCLEEKKLDAEEFYKDLQKNLNSYANKSEFGCFINACDCNRDAAVKDLNIIKAITRLFLEKRTITELTPKEWIQAILDSGSSRRKGKAGEKKLLEIAVKNKFVLVNNWRDFKNSTLAVANFSNKTFNIANIKSNLGIDVDFGNQGKKLDIILKSNDNFIFIEAKHMSLGGGGQDKQVDELIKILKKRPVNKNTHYVCFLDGVHSNKLLDIKEENIVNPDTITGSGKISQQQKAIINAIHSNPENMWVNTYGYTELIKNLAK